MKDKVIVLCEDHTDECPMIVWAYKYFLFKGLRDLSAMQDVGSMMRWAYESDRWHVDFGNLTDRFTDEELAKMKDMSEKYINEELLSESYPWKSDGPRSVYQAALKEVNKTLNRQVFSDEMINL